jgi:cytochrome c oxidase cbb3-type subunit 4
METFVDINVLRSAITVLTFVAFIGIVWWAYRRRSQQGFEDAARLPFADTIAGPQRPTDQQHRRHAKP